MEGADIKGTITRALFYNELVYALKIFGTAGRLSRYNAPQLEFFSSGLFSDEVRT
jgi:hypothetical protein